MNRRMASMAWHGIACVHRVAGWRGWRRRAWRVNAQTGSLRSRECCRSCRLDARRGKRQEETLLFDINGEPDPDSLKIMVWRPKVSDWTRRAAGKRDCIAFGRGPGLQCVINVDWEEMWRGSAAAAQLGGVSDLKPAMILATPGPTPGSCSLKSPTACFFSGRRVAGGKTSRKFSRCHSR